MRILSVDNERSVASVLSKLADKIEPKPAERLELMNFRERQAFLKKQISSKARILRAARNIPQLNKAISTRDNCLSAQPTSGHVKMHDDESMTFFTDGSLRHIGGRVKGKANVKAYKRLRRQRREALTHGAPEVQMDDPS